MPVKIIPTVKRAEALRLIKDFEKNEKIIMAALDKNGDKKLDESELGKAIVRATEEQVKAGMTPASFTINNDEFRKMIDLDPEVEKFYFLRRRDSHTSLYDLHVMLDLHKADLSGQDLQDVYLGGESAVRVDLTNANLDNANLSGAFICGGDLDGVSLNGANCDKTSFWGSSLMGIAAKNTNFNMAQFSFADLLGMKAESANFNGAVFDHARMTPTWICPK